MDEDLLDIENNLAANSVPWSVVGFHAQQAAEKALKAILIDRGENAPRTHDLGVLLRRCVSLGVPLHSLAGDCDLLTPFAVANRYPGAGPDATESEGRLAVDAAHRIVTSVRRLVPP